MVLKFYQEINNMEEYSHIDNDYISENCFVKIIKDPGKDKLNLGIDFSKQEIKENCILLSIYE